MRAFVFTDEALAKHAGQFVWLSIDTEKTGNAAFSKKYPIKAWPSFYIIDPATETITLRWVGGATVAQLDQLFARGERAAGGGEVLARADALYGQGKYAESIPPYRDALRKLSPKSPEYARATEALLFSLLVEKQRAECVALAREALPKLRGTPTRVTLAAGGLDCALRLPADAPGRADAIAALESEARAILADSELPMAADDRSALYGSIVDARDDAKDEAGARAVAREWAAYLDGVAAGLTDPEQRTALDPNRLGAYQAAGEIAKAIPMLEQSEKDFPKDYNPPARLALVYLRLKRYDEGLVATDRALALVYGPRRVRVLEVQADLYRGRGDADAARKTLQEALTFAEELPAGQRSDSQIASLRKKLDEAGGAP